MRLLTRKEVDRSKTLRENQDNARLYLVNEELARRTNILNQVVDGVDDDKERIIKEFESFRKGIANKRSKLNSEIVFLEQQKEILEIESIKERATTIALEELENTFLDKKRKVEGSLKEQKGQLSQKQKDLLNDLRKYTYQLERVDERAISQDERENKLQDRKEELERETERLEGQKQMLDLRVVQDREGTEERLLEIETGRSSNELVKTQLNNQWKDLEKEKLELIQEKMLIKDSVREVREQNKEIERKEKHNEKVNDNLGEEWARMERDKVSLKEGENTFKTTKENLQKDITKFQADKSTVRIEKQNTTNAWKEIAKANIKLKDERAILDSAWRELKSK